MPKVKLRPIIFWILAMILCPLGVCFASRSGFGVSMIEAPVYVLFNYIGIAKSVSWFTFGTAEYFMQGVLLILLCIAIRRFRLRYLLSFVTALVFGLILDCWNNILGSARFEAMPARVMSAVAGMLITAFAVALFFRTWLPQEVWELFVKELSERYALNMTKVKWVYDWCSLGLGVILMLIFFGRFDFGMIGVGTLVTTAVNAPVIGACGKLIDRFAGKYDAE